MVIGDDQTGAEMNCAPTNLKKLQEVSCETLMKLILRKRNETEPVMYKRPGKWNEVTLYFFYFSPFIINFI